MALSDTARLIASLELQDRFSGPARGIESSLGGLERRVGTLGRIGSEASRGVSAAIGNLQRIGVVAAGVIAANVTAGVQSLIRLEEVQAQTDAVLASTRGIAGITATEVRSLAEEYENLNATMDDKVIQSAQNLLLTFTNIRKDAFEPALQAALDMNQAMGGGEEGLQGTIVQLGKALQDPIKGITALRKVGVNFTQAQRDQIKGLVEANDLFGAQQVILAELGTEFGGSFAAAGDTAAGKFGAIKDAVEDAQVALATAFLPVLGRVGDELEEFLSRPEVIARIKEFGEDLAGGLDDVINFAGQVPWEAIGSAFEIAGRGARAVLDSFKALPPWIQTAVITGWGLNKLTGGALGNIVGSVGEAFIKRIMGINAGVVNINAGVVNGGGGGIPAGGRAGGGLVGGLARGAATGVAAASPVLAGLAVVEVINFENMRQEQRTGLQGILDELPRTAGTIDTSISRIDAQINQERPLLEGILFNTNVKPQLEEERAELLLLRGTLEKRTLAIDASIGSAAQSDHQDAAIAVARLATIESTIGTAAQADRTDAATATARLSAIDSSIGSAAQSDRADAATQRAAIAAAKERIAAVVSAVGAAQTAKAETVAAAVRSNTAVLGAKNFAPDVNVTVNATSNVTISEIQRRITSQQIAMTTSSGLGGGI